MKNREFDALFKNTLAHSEAPVPGHMWDAIQNKIPPRKRSRRYLLFGILLLTSLAALSLLTYVSTIRRGHTDLELRPDPVTSRNVLNGESTSEQQSGRIAAGPEDNAQPRAKRAEPADDSPNTLLQDAVIRPAASSGENAGATNQDPAEMVRMAATQGRNVQARPIPSSGPRQQSQNRTIDIGMPLKGLSTGQIRSASRSIRNIDPEDCYKFGKNGAQQLSIDLYTGMAYAFKGLGSREENVEDYIRQRRDSETFLSAFQAGARINYHRPGGLLLRGGLHYTIINERFDYIDEDARQTQTVITIDTVFSGGQIVSINMDTIQSVISGTLIKEIYNRFHTVDVPLIAGYHFEHRDWAFELSGGPVINLLFRKRGEILSPALEPISVNDDQQPVFRDWLGISLYGSVTILKRIGHKTFLFAEPHFHYRIDPVSSEDYPIVQRAGQGGLSVGIRLKL